MLECAHTVLIHGPLSRPPTDDRSDPEAMDGGCLLGGRAIRNAVHRRGVVLRGRGRPRPVNRGRPSARPLLRYHGGRAEHVAGRGRRRRSGPGRRRGATFVRRPRPVQLRCCGFQPQLSPSPMLGAVAAAVSRRTLWLPAGSRHGAGPLFESPAGSASPAGIRDRSGWCDSDGGSQRRRGIRTARLRQLGRWRRAPSAQGPTREQRPRLLVLQRRFLKSVSSWPEIDLGPARPHSCQARGQVAVRRY